MPYNSAASGTALTASFLNTNYRDQVISTVTSATRPSGTEGQVIYETDTDRFYYYNGGWVEWFKTAAWNTYTPTLTQSGAATKTTTRASYIKQGRLVTVSMYLTVTATGSAVGGNLVTASLPVTSAFASNMPVGTGWLYDSSATTVYPALAAFASTTTVGLIDSTVTGGAYLGASNFTAALNANDVFTCTFTYESAS